MNLSRIRTELAKLQELAFERERLAKLPLTIFVLPDDDVHDPDADVGLPLPRIAWRDGRAVCVLYDIEAGQPDAEDIGRLIEGTP